MLERKILPNELSNIVTFLSTIDLFKKFQTTALNNLASSMSIVFLEGGETLIKQGDLEPSMYILYNGRLRVYVQKEAKAETINVAEISVGQFVGEIALLTNVPRTGTVRAVRDSIALKLDEASFKTLEKEHPDEVIEIAKTAIKRLVTPSRPTQEGENVRTIAVAPAGNSDHRPFIRSLVEAFNQMKPTLLVTKELCNDHFKANIAQVDSNDPNNAVINQWLTDLEQKHSYIVYETDLEISPWTKRCLRQADKVLLIADDSVSPSYNSIEAKLFSTNSKIPLPCIELIIIHPDDSTVIKGSVEWLKIRNVAGFHHLKLGSEKDFAKLMRFLNGTALGLVLSGGGIRASSHAGVIRALCEMNFPIDFIGGTSMGAFIGAIYAYKGLDEILVLEKDTKMYSINRDFTLPIIALLKGKKITELYERYFGETTYIEDLSTRFFCVSANVTESKLQVHDRGLICDAIRASTALPAIFPPFYDAEGNSLVDGGVLNNMPVDVMRKLMCGGKIIAANSNSGGFEVFRRLAKKQWQSGWKLLYDRLNPFNKNLERYDNVFQILRTSMSLSADSYQQTMAKQADFLIEINTGKYGLFGFDDRHEIIELGYQAAKKKLAELIELQAYVPRK